jgi:NADPH:quinone reductase-like Zn-dependent oxidoreductase
MCKQKRFSAVPSALCLTLLLAMASGASAATIPSEQLAIVQHGIGGPEVLKLETVSVPEPAEGQVLLKIYAAGVNPVDWKKREGIGGRRPGENPPSEVIPGFDAAGIVVKLGPGVEGLKVGEAVAGSVGGGGSALNGAYAHYALAPASQLIPKPHRLSFAAAAGLGVAGGTAALSVYRLGIRPGQSILITGAAGGVGSALVQLAKAKGARVLGTASAGHFAYLKELGVDQPIDYTMGDWSSQAKDVDIVYDTIGGTTGLQALGVLKKGGQFIGINGEAGEPNADQCVAAGVNCVALRPTRPGDPSSSELLNGIAELAARGKFKVHIEKTFPLEKAADAQQLSKEGHAAGKIILAIDRAKAESR